MNLRPMRTVGGSAELAAKWDALYARAVETLKQRIAEMDIPHPSRLPLQDVVVAYRIENEYQGKMVIPDEFKGRHDAPYSVGVLLMAGAEAMDVLESHGVLPGDFITFGRFAGDEETDARIQEAVRPRSAENPNGSSSPIEAANRSREIREESLSKKKLLKLKVADVQESVDGFDRLHGPNPTMEMVRLVDAKGNPIHVLMPL